MTELSFLLDLLLNHKLPRPTKEAITERIKEIEMRQVQASMPRTMAARAPTNQSPSTQRILDEMAAEGQAGVPIAAMPVDVSHVGQTPAAAAALQRRQEAIAIAVSGKEEKGRTSPRKF